MVSNSTFSDAITPVTSFTPPAREQKKEAGCKYWIKQIFCCACCCRKKAPLPELQPARLDPTSADELPTVPVFNLNAYYQPSSIAPSVLDLVSPTSTSEEFSLDAPSTVSVSGTDVQVTISVGPSGAEGAGKASRTGQSMLSSASIHPGGSGARNGLFTIIRTPVSILDSDVKR